MAVGCWQRIDSCISRNGLLLRLATKVTSDASMPTTSQTDDENATANEDDSNDDWSYEDPLRVFVGHRFFSLALAIHALAHHMQIASAFTSRSIVSWFLGDLLTFRRFGLSIASVSSAVIRTV